jgi:RimJ/RimL family protein N-acetyltransferase
MKYFPKITRGNVYLSPVNANDYELFTKWMNDSRISDWVNNTKSIISIISEKDFLENISKDNDPTTKAFAIIKKDGDKLLWMVDLWRINYIDQIATIWIWIGDFEEHNKWYWADAINAILLFWFHTLNLRNIDLHVFAFNQWAIKCYQKVWFKEYGRRKETHYCNWKFRDEIYMDITKSEREEKNKEQILSLSK